MYEKIPTAGLSRLEWLQLRKQGIGGSDAGAVCGLNPYSSQMNVFLDKTSAETKEFDSEAVRIGSDLEQYSFKVSLKIIKNSVDALLMSCYNNEVVWMR